MKRFEYKEKEFSFDKTDELFIKFLNEQGEKGWEVVQTVPDVSYLVVLFKRQIIDE